MKQKKTFFIFIFFIVVFAFSFFITAENNQVANFLDSSLEYKIDNQNLILTEIKDKKTFHHLNKKDLGKSIYDKVEEELQQFNRPDIGIVGKDEDPTSFYEYRKKILGSSY